MFLPSTNDGFRRATVPILLLAAQKKGRGRELLDKMGLFGRFFDLWGAIAWSLTIRGIKAKILGFR